MDHQSRGGQRAGMRPELDVPARYLGMTLRVYRVVAEGGREYLPTVEVGTPASTSGFFPPCACPVCKPGQERVLGRVFGTAAS